MRKYKIISLALVAFLALGQMAYAENSATAYSPVGYYGDQQVFVVMANRTTTDISSNQVVILDVSTTGLNVTKSTAACITTTTTADDTLAIGVTDEVIEGGTTGRVCVRGPHKVVFATTGGPAVAGASLTTTTTAGSVQSSTVTGGPAIIGLLLSTTADPKRNPAGIPIERDASYWAWVGNK